MSNPKPKHRRRIRISVVLPAAVDLLVGTDDADPSDESDWEILSVLSVSCEATPTEVAENMHSEDFDALNAAAAKAKDQR